jgi:hypothetical protein
VFLYFFLILLISFIVICLTMAGDDNTKPKFCARCGHRHEGPTGKRPLDVNFEAVPVTEESTPEVPVTEVADDRFSTLVSVMSQLADRMHAQQIQLIQLQEVLSVPALPPVAAPTAVSGAIPKRPMPSNSGSCASDVNRSSFPDLATLRDDPAAVTQATNMIDGLDLGPTGTILSSGSSAGVRSMRRGWACPVEENAPRIPVPWSQDFIIGQGRKPRLL